jgi:hypothetical protein
VDPVRLVRAILREADGIMPDDSLSEMSLAWVDARAMCRVVLAAAERVRYGHNESCKGYSTRGHFAVVETCDCGHDALAAALKGEE